MPYDKKNPDYNGEKPDTAYRGTMYMQIDGRKDGKIAAKMREVNWPVVLPPTDEFLFRPRIALSRIVAVALKEGKEIVHRVFKKAHGFRRCSATRTFGVYRLSHPRGQATATSDTPVAMG